MAALIALERGWNRASILALDLSRAERLDDGAGGRAAYRIELDKPRRGPERRYTPVILTGRQARWWEMAVALTQPARDTLAALGHPTTQLLVATSQARKTGHPTQLFITDWQAWTLGSLSWHRKAQLVADDGGELRVTFPRLRKTWLGTHRRPTQNTREVLEQSYLRHDPEVLEIAREQVEQEQTDMVAEAKRSLARSISIDDLAAAQSGVGGGSGLSPAQAKDISRGHLDTPSALACLDIFHSPHPEDAGGVCTASPLMCLACPNAVSTPAHLPKQLALAQALVNGAAALYGTSRDGQYDLHFLRVRSLIEQATPAEIEQARLAITVEHIEIVDRLLRREFDVW